MRFLFYLSFFSIMLCSYLLSQELLPTETNLTIYQNDYASIFQKVEYNLSSSPGYIYFIIPSSSVVTSSFAFSTRGEILEQNISQHSSLSNAWLDKSFGNNVTVFTPSGQSFKGKLMHFSDFGLILNTNEQKTIFIKDLEGFTVVFDNYPYPEPEKSKVAWFVKPEKVGKNFGELFYHTTGINWSGKYFIYLDDEKEKLILNAFASITNNSGINFESVNLKLVEGRLNIPTSSYQYINSDAEMMSARTINLKFEQEEALFDFFSYSYPTKVNFKDNETKLLSIFKALDVPFKKTYKYILGVYPALNRRDKPTIEISFANKKENNLGILLPKGQADLYFQSKTGFEFIGSSQIQSIPIGDLAVLNAGKVSDLAVEVKKAEHIQHSTTLSERRYTVVCYNFKSKETAIVIEYFDTQPLSLVKTNFKPQIEESSRLVFNLPIKPNSSVELRFAIQAGQ